MPNSGDDRPTATRTFRARWFGDVLGLAVAYVVAGVLGFQVAIPPGNVSVLWPPSAIALVVLLRRGTDRWPGVWLGSLGVNTWGFAHQPDYAGGALLALITGAAIGLGASVQAVAGARLLRRHQSLHKVSDVVVLIAGSGLASCLTAATVGVTALWAAGLVGGAAFVYTWFTWWLGDATGVLLVAPLLLTWLRPRPAAPPASGPAVAMAGVLLVLCELVFRLEYPLLFLTLPPALWAAVRFGPRGAALASVVVCGRAVVALLTGDGPFRAYDVNTGLLITQAYAGTVGTTAMLLAAVFAERRELERGLAVANEELEARVAARTAELGVSIRKLDTANRELSRTVAEQIAANQRANRIFSALTKAMPGTVLDGRYRLGDNIGRGGFAAVYRADRVADGRAVAVKVFEPQPGNDSYQSAERFLREGGAAARVRHPHAVEVYDSGVSPDGLAYLVMELLDGEPLSGVLARAGRVGAEQVGAILAPIGEALHAAHRNQVLHRDVKPANIFLHRAGGRVVPKLLDFGLAKELDTVNELPEVTRAGQVFGTPFYMAPECWAGIPATASADTYSLAMTAYTMLVGTPGVPATDHYGETRDLCDASATGRPAPFETRSFLTPAGGPAAASPPASAGFLAAGRVSVGTLRATAPPALALAIEKALAPDPGGRLPLDGLIEALRHVGAGV